MRLLFITLCATVFLTSCEESSESKEKPSICECQEAFFGDLEKTMNTGATGLSDLTERCEEYYSAEEVTYADCDSYSGNSTSHSESVEDTQQSQEVKGEVPGNLENPEVNMGYDKELETKLKNASIMFPENVIGFWNQGDCEDYYGQKAFYREEGTDYLRFEEFEAGGYVTKVSGTESNLIITILGFEELYGPEYYFEVEIKYNEDIITINGSQPFSRC